MNMEQIVVSGVGLLAAVGLDAEECWNTIRAGKSGITKATSVEVSEFISNLAGELPGGREWTPRQTRTVGRGLVDRCHAIALDAASEAIADADLQSAGYASDRIGISLGTSLGGARSGELFHRQWLEQGLRSANAALLRQYPLHSVTDYLAEQFKFGGPRTVQSNACAAGAVAIAYAVELIRSGQADAVIAGGVDPLAYFSFGGFSCLGALDPQHCAPYTRSSGLNLGEGAGIVVLERRAAVETRGGRILSVIGGYGLSADAHHPTAPDPTGRGAIRAIRAALEMAGIEAAAIDYINGHGTGTPANDSVETRLIAHLRQSAPPPVSSTKSMVGHTLGAAGAVETVATILALRDSTLPPTVVPDAGIDAPYALDIVPGTGRHACIDVALSNSFAFGGNNATLLLQSASAGPRQVSPDRSVVITGVAALAGLAANTDALREALRESKQLYGSEFIELDHFGRFPVAEIPDDNLKRGINPQMIRRIDSLGRRAAIATADLLRERNLTRDETTASGLIFATGTGPLSTVETFQRELIKTGSGNTRRFPNTVMNAAGGHVALLNRIQGPTATICAGNTSGVSALHFATRLIQQGAADRIIVLAADEAPGALLAGYARIPGYLSRTECRPFQNSGKVFGGASVAILLEAEEVAPPDQVRGRIEGFGLTGDGSGPGLLEPTSDAWERAFRGALADAALSANDIDIVISAASGRAVIDDLELKAIKSTGLENISLSAPKSVFGDAGASSALVGVLQTMWMREERPEQGRYAVVHSIEHQKRNVCRALVSSVEAGGSYQALIVKTD